MHTTVMCDVFCCHVQVSDEEAYRFIANCVGDPQHRHTASQLLEDPFLQVCSQQCTAEAFDVVWCITVCNIGISISEPVWGW